MDDNQIKVSFPLGSGDFEVMASRPTEGQMFVLALSRKPADNDPQGQFKMVQRVTRVMESLVGAEQWSRIEDALLTGEITVMELMSLVGSIMKFDWTLGAQEETATLSEFVPQTPVVAKPERQPRVVSGG